MEQSTSEQAKIILAKVKDPREPRLQELLQSWYLFCLM